MSNPQINEIESACGVTAEDVKRTRAESYITRDGAIVLPAATSPALASAAARYAAGGPVMFVGFNAYGQPVYRSA